MGRLIRWGVALTLAAAVAGCATPDTGSGPADTAPSSTVDWEALDRQAKPDAAEIERQAQAEAEAQAVAEAAEQQAEEDLAESERPADDLRGRGELSPSGYDGGPPGGGIDHDWPTNRGPGDPGDPIANPYPALPGDPNGDGVACEYGCKN